MPKLPKQKSNTNGATAGYWSSLWDDVAARRQSTVLHTTGSPQIDPATALQQAVEAADAVSLLRYGGPALVLHEHVMVAVGGATYIATVTWTPSAQDVYEFDDRQ